LDGLFYQLRDEDPDSAREVAQLLIDWQLDAEHGETLSGILPLTHPEPDLRGLESQLCAGTKVRVLFVGGNEIQARYDERIIEQLSREWPGVRVRFEHTGWSPNWGREVDGLVKEGSGSDAVVIMRMIRTMLGRTLRERIDSPWVACTGTGCAAMTESIRKAALVGLKRRSAQVQ
jgi:hypothetical protein